MFRLSSFVVALVAAACLALALECVDAGRSTIYTCALCRIVRSENIPLGFTRTAYHENECSQWYENNVERGHTHIWARSSCSRLLNAFGQSVGWGCGFGSPLWSLEPNAQKQFYLHFTGRQKAKELFKNLADAKWPEERLDEHDQSKGQLIVQAISSWDTAGFPGTWDEWWNRFWEKHVAEHNEWLAWLHADRGLSFEDWKNLMSCPTS